MHGDPEASHLLRPTAGHRDLPAHSRAASSSATSTTAKPPRCSLDSMNGPSVNSGVPLDASTLNTGAASSRPPGEDEDPSSLHLCHERPDSLALLAKLPGRVVGHPLVVEGDEVLSHVSSFAGMAPCRHPPPPPRTAAPRSDTASGSSGGRDRPPGGPGDDVKAGGHTPIRCRGDGQGDHAPVFDGRSQTSTPLSHMKALSPAAVTNGRKSPGR